MRAAAMIRRIEPPVTPGGPPAVLPTATVIRLRQRDPWQEASDRAREVATARESLVLYVRALLAEGVTQNNAVGLLLTRAGLGTLPLHFIKALVTAAKAGRTAPSRSAICAWCALYREGGVVSLLPEHKGRVVESAGWWGPALEHFNAPSQPDMRAVHRLLTEVEGFAVSYEQVRHYLAGVPAMLGKNSPARIGKNLYRLTQKAYIRRSTEHALPGDVYVADGYRGDIYLAHPITGDIWRPEFTAAIDLRSRYLVGWRADEHEGTYAVQNMWAECFAHWGHVPPMIYADNGSGYKNRLMSDDLTGFYSRAGVIEVIHALPGNPHGKGWVERFFRIVADDFLKTWKPQFYCGRDAAPEALNRTVRECKAGRLQPPSLAEFSAAFNDWLTRYHARPHPEDKTTTRAALWAALSPIAPAASVTELKRQAVTLTVRRASVRHGRREYGHEDLHAFNGQRLILEYDLIDNSIGVMRTLDGRWVCDAHLIETMDAIDRNRLDEKRQQRAANALARLEKKAVEQRARAGLLIDADALADGPVIDGVALRIPQTEAVFVSPSSPSPDSDDEIRLFDF